jgi:hypothetical protein
MTTFVMWKAEIDDEFRAAYEEVALETIQKYPLENIDGTYFMVGSSRLQSDNAMENLRGRFPNSYVIISIETQPEEWVPKVEE